MRRFLLGSGFIVFFLISVGANDALAKNVREVEAREDSVVTIQTSLGYSTLLQFDGPVANAVVGDLDSFKVERAGGGLAVKPVVMGAKSNLFVKTGDDRFAFRLVTGPAADADYLVKVRRPVPRPKDFGEQPLDSAVTPINRRVRAGGVELCAQSVTARDDVVEISFTVSLVKAPLKSKALVFEPGDIAIFDAKQSLNIEHLYLDRLQLSAIPLRGAVVIKDGHDPKSLVLAFSPDIIAKTVRGGVRVALKAAAKGRQR